MRLIVSMAVTKVGATGLTAKRSAIPIKTMICMIFLIILLSSDVYIAVRPGHRFSIRREQQCIRASKLREMGIDKGNFNEGCMLINILTEFS